MENQQPKIERKTEFAGKSSVVQLLGLALCFFFFPIGLILGILLIIIGSAMSRAWHCSECGTRLTSGKIKICPGCQSRFEH